MVNHFGSLKKMYDLSNHGLTRNSYETIIRIRERSILENFPLPLTAAFVFIIFLNRSGKLPLVQS